MRSRSYLTAAGALTLVCLSGCYIGDPADRTNSIRTDPSPNLETLYQRNEDRANAVSLTTDTNWRMFNEDMGRFWLLDRPSRLTPEPMPH
jgi:hypothetical protein